MQKLNRTLHKSNALLLLYLNTYMLDDNDIDTWNLAGFVRVKLKYRLKVFRGFAEHAVLI